MAYTRSISSALLDAEIYADSQLFFMNPSYKSEEAFFGENNPLKMAVIQHIKNMRTIYNTMVDEKNSIKEKKAQIPDFKEEADALGRTLAKGFNVQKVYIGLFEEVNAFCVPMAWDKNLIEKEGKNKIVNKEFRFSLEDIIETKDGFKFKDSTNKIFVFGLGIGFFSNGYSDEEISAILFHEFGHSFQHLIASINENLISYFIANSVELIYQLLNPFVVLGTFGISIFLSIIESCNLNKLEEKSPEIVGDELILNVIGPNEKDMDRELMGRQVINESDNELKSVIHNEHNKKINDNIFTKIGKFFLGIFVGLFTMVINLIMPIFNLINPGNIALLANMNFLKKNKRWEQFADMFASNYGLGKQLSSALAKLGKESERINLYTLNFLNYVPVLNVVLAVGHYTTMAPYTLLAGYPSMRNRIVGIYKSCQYEIENNKDLTPQEKKDLQEHLDSIQKVYDDYVYDLGPRNFVYGIWHKIIDRQLKDQKSDITENVLVVLKEEEAKMKLKNKDNDTTKIPSMKKIEFVKAAFNILKPLKNLGMKESKMVEYTNLIKSI
jgi:Zn-dependent protease with chaperone function